MMVIDSKYYRGEIVYLITDPYQYKRVVTAIIVRDEVTYEVARGTEVTEHNVFELSLEEDVKMKIDA